MMGKTELEAERFSLSLRTPRGAQRSRKNHSLAIARGACGCSPRLSGARAGKTLRADGVESAVDVDDLAGRCAHEVAEEGNAGVGHR